MMYVNYACLTLPALPYTDNSADLIDAILSSLVFFQMLMAASWRFADAGDVEVEG